MSYNLRRPSKFSMKIKQDKDHYLDEKNTLNELSNMYPELTMKQIRTLKQVQDSAILNKYDPLDIVDLKCSKKKKQQLYELFLRLENEAEYSEEFFMIRNEINIRFKSIQSPEITLKHKIKELNANTHNKDKLLHKYKQLKNLSETDPMEKSTIEQWLQEAIKLPFDHAVDIQIDDSNIKEFLLRSKKILDEEVYGLSDVKHAIIRYLCIRCLNPETRAQNLALCGPPGVGKTAIAKAVSKIMDLPFYQISLGGVTNPEFLKGFESTYVGSKCGQIARALQSMKAKNGIIFFDEFDKIDQNRDVTSSLLHITDPQQNDQFCDVYFENLFLDLSSIWFIFSMNELPENKPLLDRLNVIHIQEYTDTEKKAIITDFIVPKLLKQFQLTKDLSFESSAVEYILRECSSKNNSIRTIIGAFTTIVEKVYVFKKSGIITDECKLTLPAEITKSLVEKMLLKDPCGRIQDSVRHLYI